ncbi:MAG: phytase [Anaerohalosphaeraceae bacterium]|nr:phytase [Anaerohalosphaeraceae bacterium]
MKTEKMKQFCMVLIVFGLLLSASAYSAVNVDAAGETGILPGSSSADIADDICIWVHPTNPNQSIVIGQSKDSSHGGIYVYDLSGVELQAVDMGHRTGNIDIRYNFAMSTGPTDIVVVNDREEDDLKIYRVNSDRTLTNINYDHPNIGIEPYGGCLYNDLSNGRLYYFVTAKDGTIRQFELTEHDSTGLIEYTLARAVFDVGGQVEGAVADDENNLVYFGEEDAGVWRYDAKPGGSNTGTQIVSVNTGELVADVEGLSMYYTSDGDGYLLVSSQGNSKIIVYERTGSHTELGAFHVNNVSETDGIDVINVNLGASYDEGLFVLHDGENDGSVPTNWKYVSWGGIANALNLTVDTAWNPRHAPVTVYAEFVITDLDSLSISAHTGEKPQSKVWTYDGQWWCVLSSTSASSSGTWVWKLQGTTWVEALKLSNETGTKADVKRVGSVVHVLLYDDDPELVSIEYSGGAYQLWTLRPTPSPVVALLSSETASIDVDSEGRMWLAMESDGKINVYYSDSPYDSWSSDIELASGVGSDDICVVTAMPNNIIGVLWSNQNSQRFGFRVHTDGVNPATWSTDEVPASQSAQSVGGGMADDHLNVAVASDGTLYAAVKTSYDTSGYPRIALLVRRPSGVWDDLYQVDTAGTRPIVLLNEAENTVTVVYSATTVYANIKYKQSATSAISFVSSHTLIDDLVNNVTSMKENYAGEVVVLASDGNSVKGVRCAEPFRFTAAADNRPIDPENIPRWEWMLDEMTDKVGGEGVFHIMAGDFDDPQTTDALLKTQFGESVIWYPVTGNHETDTPSEMQWVRDAYSGLPYIVNAGPTGCGTTTYSFDYGNAHFVVINEYYDGSSDVGTDGDVVDELYDWLAADLAANAKPAVFVLGHEPAYPEYRHVGDSLDQYPAHRDRFWKLLNDNHVAAYICGHTHTYYAKQVDGPDWEPFTWQIDCGNAGNQGESKQTFIDITVEGTEVIFNTWQGAINDSYVITDSWTVPISSSNKASNPSPANEATQVSVDTNLSWIAGVNAVAHDVYFGTDPVTDFPLVSQEQSGTVYDLGTLAYDILYYWAIDEHDSNSVITPGSLWNFTTVAFGVLYQTDFENFATGSIDGQDGWDVEVTNAEVTTDSAYIISGGKSLVVYYGAGNAMVAKSFTPTAIVDIEFDTGDCATDKNGRFRIEDSSGNVAAQVNFTTGGQISANNGSTAVNLMPYEDYDTNKKSYNFRIVADTGTQTYDFYVDDVIKADDYSFYGSTGSHLSEFKIKRYTSRKLIVDNLVIKNGAPPTCGDFGYPEGDLNEDCYTDMLDLVILADGWLDTTDMNDVAILVDGWLDCTDPTNERCN